MVYGICQQIAKTLLFEVPYSILHLTSSREAYWKDSPIPHYRNDGPIKTQCIFTIESLRSSLGEVWRVQYAKKEVTGRLMAIKIESDFEWLIIEDTNGITTEVRLDLIHDLEDPNA